MKDPLNFIYLFSYPFQLVSFPCAGTAPSGIRPVRILVVWCRAMLHQYIKTLKKQKKYRVYISSLEYKCQHDKYS